MTAGNEPKTETAAATAQIADACMRLKVPYRVAPAGIRPVSPLDGMLFGPVVPVRHYGSVDVFLEALETAPAGGILVIDNGGRTDEACIGDLTVLEVKYAGLKAMVVWGLHRDTADLVKIGFPVFSYGAYPIGPARLNTREKDAFSSAHVGNFMVTASDTAFVDADGVLFVESSQAQQVLSEAKLIRAKEKEQAIAANKGVSLRDQFQFKTYLQKRETVQGYTFRQHLSAMAKSIEE